MYFLQNFFIRFRRSITHYLFMADGVKTRARASTPTDLNVATHPRTPEEWQDMKSAKLDLCLKVVQYYLEADNKPPLELSEQGELRAKNPNPSDPHDWSNVNARPDGLPPDKIVLFSNFPVNNALIVRVS